MHLLFSRYGGPAEPFEGPEPKVLRSFRIRVDKIDEDTAYVTLLDVDIEEPYATIAIKELPEGTTDVDLLRLDILQAEDGLSHKFTKIERQPLSAEEMAEIDRKLDEMLPDHLFEGDES